MLDFNQFAETIKEEMERKHPELGFEINDITKNNGVRLKALNIKEKNTNVFPNLYLESYYQLYESGETTISDICDKIWDMFQRVKGTTPEFDMDKLIGELRERVIFRLINLERNRERLRNSPFIPMQDLAIVFYLPLELSEEGLASCMINNWHMEQAGLTLDELFACAKNNTKRMFEPKIESLFETILSHMPEEMKESRKEEMELMKEIDDDMQMYVVTNKLNINGAAVILYEGILSELAYKLDTDELVIFPSSIHECMIMKKDNGMTLEYMRNMVLEANTTAVAEHEILSDNIYIYNRKSGTISVSVA